MSYAVSTTPSIDVAVVVEGATDRQLQADLSLLKLPSGHTLRSTAGALISSTSLFLLGQEGGVAHEVMVVVYSPVEVVL